MPRALSSCVRCFQLSNAGVLVDSLVPAKNNVETASEPYAPVRDLAHTRVPGWGGQSRNWSKKGQPVQSCSLSPRTGGRLGKCPVHNTLAAKCGKMRADRGTPQFYDEAGETQNRNGQRVGRGRRAGASAGCGGIGASESRGRVAAGGRRRRSVVGCAVRLRDGADLRLVPGRHALFAGEASAGFGRMEMLGEGGQRHRRDGWRAAMLFAEPGDA